MLPDVIGHDSGTAKTEGRPDETAQSVPPPSGGRVRELRIALVCYGGVSLAIYMHG